MEEWADTDIVYEVGSTKTVSFKMPSPAELVSLIIHCNPDIPAEDLDDLEDNAPQCVHRSWWRTDVACKGDDDCRCGQIPLFEVLSAVDTKFHPEIIRRHVAELRGIWLHLWDADAINGVSQDAAREQVRQIEGVAPGSNLCPQCLIGGFEHLSDLSHEANNLSVDLGEALAVHPKLVTYLD